MKNKRCTTCIIDTTVPGVIFDENGRCNFCLLHENMEKEYPTGNEGAKRLREIAARIKNDGTGGKYDCIVGVSGGRDSSFTLYYTKKVLGLRPLAVHFNDGFGNPLAGENMVKVCHVLGVDIRTITSDWRQSKDLKIAFLKASTMDLEEGTDIGIATSLYSIAVRENLKYIIVGQSFRTEGIAPLSWNYLDGKYLKAVHKQFGTIPLKKWSPVHPGFNLGLKEIIYYVFIRDIKTIPILYYVDYNREEATKKIEKEFNWKNPGAHYFDDLYQSLMTYVYRVKFKVDRRLFNYSAMVRSGQMSRKKALQQIKTHYSIEDRKIIDLCIKRLGLTKKEFNSYLKLPIKSFRDYPNYYDFLCKFKKVIKFFCRINLLPSHTYVKYFDAGE
jgi:N-acetyl sugar amidotransferase